MATILLLEDDPDLHESVASALAEAGYGVLAARSLAEAESLVRQHSFELALLDVNVPASDSDSVSPAGKQRRFQLLPLAHSAAACRGLLPVGAGSGRGCACRL